MKEVVQQPSRFKELPLLKRVGVLATLGFSVIAAACGDQPTGGEPPVTTTIPATSTTENSTTTLPPTTTEPSTTTTTVAETTTTTEALTIYKASGRMLDGNTLLNLGYWKKEVSDAENVYELVTGNLLDVSIESIDFIEYDKTTYDQIQVTRDVAVFTVAFGNYDNDPNKPLIRRLWAGRPGDESNIIDRIVYARLSSANVLIGGSEQGGRPLYELVDELKRNLYQTPQIIIYLPVSYNNDYVSPCMSVSGPLPRLWACEVGLTSLDYLNSNKEIVNDIKNLQTVGYNPQSPEDTLGYFDRIITYTS